MQLESRRALDGPWHFRLTLRALALGPGLLDDPRALCRFEREAKALSGLNHPNSCTVFDVGHHDGTHFIGMEYIAVMRTAVQDARYASAVWGREPPLGDPGHMRCTLG